MEDELLNHFQQWMEELDRKLDSALALINRHENEIALIKSEDGHCRQDRARDWSDIEKKFESFDKQIEEIKTKGVKTRDAVAKWVPIVGGFIGIGGAVYAALQGYFSKQP